MFTYKVVKTPLTFRAGDEDKTITRYGISEVYENGSHTRPATSEVFVENEGDPDPIETLRWHVARMQEALDKPVLEGAPERAPIGFEAAVDALHTILDDNPKASDDDVIRTDDALSFGHVRALAQVLAFQLGMKPPESLETEQARGTGELH